MDAAARTTLTLRLTDACRVAQHGLHVLEQVAGNRTLPWHIRDRADLHHMETEGQLRRSARALQLLDPALATRLASAIETPAPRAMAVPEWIRLERREIAAYVDLMPYVRLASIDGLARDCAAALDLQRSVLHWLEAPQPALFRMDSMLGAPA